MAIVVQEILSAVISAPNGGGLETNHTTSSLRIDKEEREKKIGEERREREGKNINVMVMEGG